MKTRNSMILWVWAILLVFGLNVPAVYGAPVLIDFGNSSSWRGVTAPSPDINGHYWNSVWSGAFYPDMLDLDGNPTTIDFGFAIGGAGGTDSYNGPAGVVTSNPPTPADIARTDIDAAALGNLGVKEAAMDFYTTSRFEIQGLDPTKTYNLTFFGSHMYNENDDITVYSIYTDNTYSSLVDSNSLLVGGNGVWNRNTVARINDVDPQDNNILYIKFIASNGGLGYLNCMQIEEAPPVKARRPQPRDGAALVPLTTHLTWTKPSGYTPVKYALSFRVSNSPDPNWIVVDPVVDLNLDSDPDTTEAAVPVALNYNTTYDWKVTSFKLNDPNAFTGPVWSFTTQPQLQVNAGPNIITWLNGSTAHVALNGSITYPGALSSRLWSVVSKPATATVVIANPASAATSATLDTVGTYVLKLWAQDNSIPLESQDTAEIQVFADACQAAKANPAGYVPLPHDVNDDCKEDLADFVSFAADWLEDLSLTQNLEY